MRSHRKSPSRTRLSIRLRTLEKLIGKPAGALDTLVELKQLKAETGNIDEWATRAADGNLQAEIQRLSKTIADQEVERNRAGHYPTVDAVAGYTISNGQNFGTLQVDTRTATIGVELNLPIYQGGLTSSRVREAVANQEKARQDLEVATREASLQARQAWLNVSSGAARVQALEQALVSTKAQLASTKLGLQVGVRTNLDVLNAEQQVFSAQRDLAGARYAYLLAGLSLKAAAGTLSADDLQAIDKLLTSQRSRFGRIRCRVRGTEGTRRPGLETGQPDSWPDNQDCLPLKAGQRTKRPPRSTAIPFQSA